MISTTLIRQLAEQKLTDPSFEGTFLVDVTVSATNKIRVTLDNFRGVNIAECVAVSRFIENSLDREQEDFELEVTSAGLDQPFRIFKQYEKNLGKLVDVKLADGRKFEGKLVAATEEQIEIEQQSKERIEGRKAKQLVTKKLSFPFSEVKETRVVIKF
ncbi:MAG TPA: ribosome assembly cofactor RimP [Bacteroidia bacterium]|jgi:ribosome maturation factor RimP|nr:ribosome assembly cofactor RimP [Bacteroidia bacterium]